MAVCGFLCYEMITNIFECKHNYLNALCLYSNIFEKQYELSLEIQLLEVYNKSR
jgi:hypothetical protein